MGRGFAVVARRGAPLAARTSQATIEIADVVRPGPSTGKERGGQRAGKADKAEQGVALANSAGAVIVEIPRAPGRSWMQYSICRCVEAMAFSQRHKKPDLSEAGFSFTAMKVSLSGARHFLSGPFSWLRNDIGVETEAAEG